MRTLLICIGILFYNYCYCQDFDIDGSARIQDMSLDNASDSIVVRQSDGTLAIREAATISSFRVNPKVVGSLTIGSQPRSIFVSGDYSYILDVNSNELQIIDISNPTLPEMVGSLGVGDIPTSIYVSGRYAYVIDLGSDDLKVIDISDPSSPELTGSLTIGSTPFDISVSGRYAYVVDEGSNDLKIIDVSDPSTPSLIGSLTIGPSPSKISVSGRYAYVIDDSSNDIKVIDISNASGPTLVGSMTIGSRPNSIYVSGRYAYILDQNSKDLKIIDISNHSSPSLAGSLSMGTLPLSITVSGRYAYSIDLNSGAFNIVDVSSPSAPTLVESLLLGSASRLFIAGRYAYVISEGSDDLKVIDLSGGEYTSLIAHSLEVGNMQVSNDIIAQGQLQITGGATIGAGGLNSDGDVGIAGNLTVTHGLSPSAERGFVLQNENVLNNRQRWWSFYVQSGDGDLLLYSEEGNTAKVGEFKATTGTYTATSDRRLKKNFEEVEDILDKVEDLDVYKYHMTSERSNQAKHYGLIAQDVAAYFPELVHYDEENDIYHLEYSTLGVLAVQAIKELSEKVGSQEKELVEIRRLLSELID